MSANGAAQISFVFCAGPLGLGCLQIIPRADARGYSMRRFAPGSSSISQSGFIEPFLPPLSHYESER